MTAPLTATSLALQPQAAVRPVKEPFLLGSLGAFNRDRLGFIVNLGRECGDIGSFHAGPLGLLALNHPSFFQGVFVDQADAFDKGFASNAFRLLMGNGILTSEGKFHQRQRKLMAAAFAPKNIAGYADIMVRDTLRNQSRWNDGDIVEIDQEMMRLSMNIGASTLFDADVFDGATELGAAIAEGFDYVNYRASWLMAPPLWFPTARNRRAQKAFAAIRRGIESIIEERRANPSGRRDLLTALLQARDSGNEAMTNEQLRDEALTIFIGGYETAAKALSWCLYLLATHPEHYARLRSEVDTVLQGRPPTAADLPSLPYSLQAYKEALRLYPPGGALARRALRDVEIGGHRIRKGQNVLLMIYTVQHRADIFEDPESFRPERFSPENEKKIPRYAYLPFGAGPRICIGNFFALLEGQLVLTTLLQQFDFELVPGQTIEPELLLTIRPKYGIKMKVRRRIANP